MVRLLQALVALAFTLGLTRLARAQTKLDGQWEMSPVQETYTARQWGAACGPVPHTGPRGKKTTVSLHENEGELSLSMGPRTFTTRDCWDTSLPFTPGDHSFDSAARTWKTKCVSPAGDPRKGTMTTALSVRSDTELVLIESGRYELNVSGTSCIVDVWRQATFKQVSSGTAAPDHPAPAPSTPTGPATPAPTAPEVPAPAAGTDCTVPGKPTRLELRPARKVVLPGASFVLKTSVTDANGCPVLVPLAWSIVAPPEAHVKALIDTVGHVNIPRTAREGTFEVEARFQGKGARATIDVTTLGNFRAAIKKHGVSDLGDSSDSVVVSLKDEEPEVRPVLGTLVPTQGEGGLPGLSQGKPAATTDLSIAESKAPAGPPPKMMQGFHVGAIGSATEDPALSVFFSFGEVSLSVGTTFAYNSVGFLAPDGSRTSDKLQLMPLLALNYFPINRPSWAIGPEIAYMMPVAPNLLPQHQVVPGLAFLYAPFSAPITLGAAWDVRLTYDRISKGISIDILTPGMRLSYVFF